MNCIFINSFHSKDENGNNRPVCSFVKPLRAGRLLHSAREAARFVSLIHQERTPTLGGGARTEQWTTMHAFLARNKGVGDSCQLITNFIFSLNDSNIKINYGLVNRCVYFQELKG
ncbi:hypothetical protein DPMN_178599 [Dreissena polymorpha]|uniref:Uncharacterized protein n=1 Tax=Dreissena polymorpha TaxID=45954 RepID=A0A9D4EB91_DREPO|nr:hypothetical protein DPMN_178599 [Dreissena polymorpha]